MNKDGQVYINILTVSLTNPDKVITTPFFFR